MLALWDHTAKSGLSIDLWTKELTVQEMNLFFYQTFMTMSETFMRATHNKELSDDIQKFAGDFLEKIKRQEKNEVSNS
jgi:gliding motility-associated protein GldC